MIPDLIAALPDHIPALFADAAPGHKFHLYFTHWEAGRFTPYKDARLPDIKHFEKPERERIRREFEARKRRALGNVCPLGDSAKAQITAIRTRQQALIKHYGTNGYHISTKSTAPFATGLGNEHPIENGFAFLTPYGLPYLAGSGVKGILRRAMQELSKDGVYGFTDETINTLFGPEKIDKPEDAQRGALDFWDVFPSPAGGKLVVEIMTPHFGEYYRGNQTPHDSGAPVPVSFLAVPAKSDFDFSVVCQPQRLPEALQTQWRRLLDQAFAHAFEWVGFGAKTSVGYGAMAAAKAAPPVVTTSGSGQSAVHTGASSTNLQTWPAAKLTLNPSTGEIVASFEGRSTTPLKNPLANELRSALGEERAAKLKKNKELKGVSVDVEPLGNALALKRLTPS
ncbi:type III-B CRISPR module RAMP protein Cmr6 [Rhodoferax antarcticus]|uniref:CRISPR-associated RAMP protein, Cmr6 family n=1 Tax=Rhodoferax antarcticus ANT.BR TaxID=1111071 RepID=A0A1Q8YEQ5_9BURK|nr:type III-B CRISPR module RAMP protein Cmr6 [Rhodoferax antarcticus]APW46305.1 type III-B CRISPR module RAMP protein Cmr6 [Rhodoferax antarcticus]OLP06518.1 CRISPR-associated RAMP protein, Cmr6 family [Rhodoferax antarcticus ANT.BR]